MGILEDILILFAVICVIGIVIALPITIADVRKEKKKKEAIERRENEEEKLRQEKEQEKQRIFIEKYGCTETELVNRFRTSPVVEKLANIIRQKTDTEEVTIFGSYISMPAYQNYEAVYFEELGLTELPNEIIVHLARALEEKLKDQYELSNIFGESCTLKRISKKADYTLHGW